MKTKKITKPGKAVLAKCARLGIETGKAISALTVNYRTARSEAVVSFAKEAKALLGKLPSLAKVSEWIGKDAEGASIVSAGECRGIYASNGWCKPVNKASRKPGKKDGRTKAGKAEKPAPALIQSVSESGNVAKVTKRAEAIASALSSLDRISIVALLLKLSRPSFDGLETVIQKEGKDAKTA